MLQWKICKCLRQTLTNGAGAVSGAQAYQLSQQRSWHLGDLACWQTPAVPHHAARPANQRKTNHCGILTITFHELKQLIIEAVIRKVQGRDLKKIPHSTCDAARPVLLQHDLYHYCPPQKSTPEYSGSSVSTMVGSVTQPNKRAKPPQVRIQIQQSSRLG